MPARKIPNSPGSSGSSPPDLSVEVRPSWRLLGSAAAFLGLALGALAVCEAPAAEWRALGAGSTLLLAWRPLLESVALRGRRAVRRFTWTGRGDWLVSTAEGTFHVTRLHGASAAFGDWIVLVWAIRGGRRVVILDAACLPEGAFRALRARLNVDAARAARRAADSNC
jgi:hypothetical protein